MRRESYSFGMVMQSIPASSSGGKRLSGEIAGSSPTLPLVTVITAVLNGDRHLGQCLESVLQQDYSNLEHIVLDGGSTDGTVDILRRYNNRIALWRSEPDKGVYDAWNKGLAEARGEWICFLGADDEFLPGAVSSYMALAVKHPQAEYLSSQIRWAHPSGYELIRGEPWDSKSALRWMRVAHVGSMHRRRLFDRLGVFNTSFGSAADYEFLLRAKETLKAAHMPIITAMMRAGGITDHPSAFADATRAKIVTGGRSPVLAIIELHIARVKVLLRPLRRVLRRTAIASAAK
jgi:glycosyltransferase involved in cell wall biosynthesis